MWFPPVPQHPLCNSQDVFAIIYPGVMPPLDIHPQFLEHPRHSPLMGAVVLFPVRRLHVDRLVNKVRIQNGKIGVFELGGNEAQLLRKFCFQIPVATGNETVLGRIVQESLGSHELTLGTVGMCGSE